MRVSEALGQALADLGVRHLFGVVGSGNFALAGAAVAAGTEFVAARHENAALCMADGYARVTRGLGVATVHQGPGLTNALTGLTEAAKARTPLLLLAADTSAAALHSNFRLDTDALVAALGATPERLHSAATARDDLWRAYRRAVEERRAVVLSLPLDVQASASDGFGPAADWGLRVDVAVREPAAADVAAVADLLAGARRPALIAGRGAVLAGAREALVALAERVGAVLATSANGHGLFAGDPWAVGISGGFASPVAAALLRDADVLVAFGASLNMWTTRHGALVGEDTAVVQVDADAAAIGRHRAVDVGVVGDAGRTATALLSALEEAGVQRSGYRDPVTAARIAAGRWRDQPYEDASGADTIDPRTLSIALDDLLPAERTVAIDSGHFMGWPAMYLAVPDADGFVFTQSFQSIGLGLGSAIGAAVARPDRVTVACVGDGGLMMALAELETAVRLRLPLLVVVYDDAAYGAEVHHFAGAGPALDLVRFPDADFAAIARAAGADGVVVRAPDDLDAVATWLERRERPLLLDAKVTPQVVAAWLEEAFRAH